MKRFSLALLAVAAALAITPAALADTFYFNFGGPGVSGGGSLTGNSLGGGEFNISGGAITIDGLSATVIVNPTPGSVSTYNGGAPEGPWTYDDVLTLAGPNVDGTGGILFLLSNGDQIELWSVGATVYWNEYVPGVGWVIPLTGNEGDPVSMNVSTTPEPSSLLLLGTGLIGLALLAFRKRKPSGLVLRA